MKKRTFEIILSILGLGIGFSWWITQDGKWEPILLTLTSALGLLYGIFLEKDEENASAKPITMKQKGGKKSTNYQAGGNMTVNEYKKDAE